MVGFAAHGGRHPDNQGHDLLAVVRAGSRQMVLGGVAFLDELAVRRCGGHQSITVNAVSGPVAIQHCEADVVGQLKCIVVDIGAAGLACNVDAQLVLQSQGTCVADLQHYIFHMARFPQSVVVKYRGFLVGLLEFATRSAVLVCQFNVQITRLDFVYCRTCGVGEPREGGADEHGHTHKDRQRAGHQRPLGRFTTCHCCFSSLSYFFNGNM